MALSAENKSLLDSLYDELDLFLKAREDWAGGYKKDRKTFRQIVRVQAKIERNLKDYFKDLAMRSLDFVNWGEYNSKLLKATDMVIKIKDIKFKNEETILVNVLFDEILEGVAVGAAAAEKTYRIPLGLTRNNAIVLEKARAHAAELIKGLNETTRDRIATSISTSLSLGEKVSDAAERLADVIDDPVRAELIARTESVNAYSEGTLAFGEESGAVSKSWELSGDPCEVCQGIYDENQTVALNEDFGDGIDSPPAHPRCACILVLNYKQ